MNGENPKELQTLVQIVWFKQYGMGNKTQTKYDIF